MDRAGFSLGASAQQQAQSNRFFPETIISPVGNTEIGKILSIINTIIGASVTCFTFANVKHSKSNYGNV